MKRQKIIHRKSSELTANERLAISGVMHSSFDVIKPVDEIIDRYCNGVRNVALMYQEEALLAFQFYQFRDLLNTRVIHFSVGAKNESMRRPGVQRRIGRSILLSSIDWRRPFRRLAFIGVCNHPKTYTNMRISGGLIFPDVEASDRPFPHADLYRRAVEEFGFEGVEMETGLIENRATRIGLCIKAGAFQGAEERDQFSRLKQYFGGDTNRGLCTMVVFKPANSFVKSLGSARKTRSSAGRT